MTKIFWVIPSSFSDKMNYQYLRLVCWNGTRTGRTSKFALITSGRLISMGPKIFWISLWMEACSNKALVTYPEYLTWLGKIIWPCSNIGFGWGRGVICLIRNSQFQSVCNENHKRFPRFWRDPSHCLAVHSLWGLVHILQVLITFCAHMSKRLFKLFLRVKVVLCVLFLLPLPQNIIACSSQHWLHCSCLSPI